MLITCYFCKINFKKPYNLKIHLQDNRCKSPLLNDVYQLHMFLSNKDNTTNKHPCLNITPDITPDIIPDITPNITPKLQEELISNLSERIITKLSSKINKNINELFEKIKTIHCKGNNKKTFNIKELNDQKIKKNKKIDKSNVPTQEIRDEDTNDHVTNRKRGRPKKNIEILNNNQQDFIMDDHGIVFEKLLNKKNIGRPKKLINNINETTTPIDIKINPITKLNLQYNLENTRNLLIDYGKYKNNNILVKLLIDYFKNIIYNKDIPENMCIKYIKKKPPTFIIHIIDEKNKDHKLIITRFNVYSCILCDVFMKLIKKELKNFLKTLKCKDDDDDDEDDEDDYYNDTIEFLLNDLKDKNGIVVIQNALRSILYDNILFDKSMKIKIQDYQKYNNNKINV